MFALRLCFSLNMHAQGLLGSPSWLLCVIHVSLATVRLASCPAVHLIPAWLRSRPLNTYLVKLIRVYSDGGCNDPSQDFENSVFLLQGRFAKFVSGTSQRTQALATATLAKHRICVNMPTTCSQRKYTENLGQRQIVTSYKSPYMFVVCSSMA